MVDLDSAPVAPPWLVPQYRTECLLCRGRSKYIGVFIPSKTSPVAPPPGKQRMMVYALCESCARNSDVLADTIEKQIEEELRSVNLI